MNVPFFRYEFDPAALAGVEECLRSGWLTTGPKTKEFERLFAEAVRNEDDVHAVAVNSCTAALHLALEAVGLQRGEIVIVPTLTFAATAEVVRYFDAIPVFVDCDPHTLNLSIPHLEHTLAALASGARVPGLADTQRRVRAIIPVHYGGQPCDLAAVTRLAARHGCEVIEDAAHAFPAGIVAHNAVTRGRGDTETPRLRSGQAPELLPSSLLPPPYSPLPTRIGGGTSRVSCFSFYANKTITTGEGGMATTTDAELAARMRLMSLHGMNRDPWNRFAKTGTWDYQLVAPGYKYNLTDIASALGISQLAQAEQFRTARMRLSATYDTAFADMEAVEPLQVLDGIQHSHHLYVIQLRLDLLAIDRAQFIEEMKTRGIICSVHWRPLHMHPYYADTYGYHAEDFPAAASVWPRIVSLPLYPSMTDEEQEHVVRAVKEIVGAHRR